MARLFCCITVLHLLLLFKLNISAEAGVVGVNYGMLGNNLPPPNRVIALLKSRNVTSLRLFEPNHDALQALQNSGIKVILGTLNQDLQMLGAPDPSFARSWVSTNVIPYSKTVHFRCISAGNEVIPSDLAAYVFPAMKNLKAALNAAELAYIPVTTCVSTAILGASYPPSRGEFSKDSSLVMRSVAAFLAANGSPLLVNVYPYFPYVDNQEEIPLSYALFNSTNVVVKDGQLEYRNLFDAITDAVYSALEKVGGASIQIVVSESGWPSKENGDIATVANAQMYVNNLIAHVSGETGTPKRPGKSIESYIFALFNENLKPPGTEQNFGLYNSDMTEVYPVDFTH
ncbi:hypothetical protein F2P56_004402 [Juglans regia]|uniref:glucan endo-1,3-beta-D-glucosidase n=2 Tax=Juglans regia TaxID=51240 RepID=A0A2I4DYH4_JUGRE|nr:putative glucan endo-1,3-beta-glucosidase GVI isoform X1 [Juglans regia]KAF5477788.1 hypothetical protein F2P56_004402 [Juglans regia]